MRNVASAAGFEPATLGFEGLRAAYMDFTASSDSQGLIRNRGICFRSQMLPDDSGIAGFRYGFGTVQ